MQTPFTFRPHAGHTKAHTRPGRHLPPAHVVTPFPNDRPLGFTPHELRHMVAEMIG